MRFFVVFFVVFLCGCVCLGGEGDVVVPTTSTSLEVLTTTTTVLSTSTTVSSTSTTLKSLLVSECEELAAVNPFAGVYCYDFYAMEHDDVDFCKTFYCYVFVSGDGSSCDLEKTNVDRRICNALASRDIEVCRGSFDTDICYRTYGLVVNDYTICQKGVASRNPGWLCAVDFARVNVDLTFCDRINSRDQGACRDIYYEWVAMDALDESLCLKIKGQSTVSSCVRAVRYAIEKSQPRTYTNLRLWEGGN
jgi:hypothetical protein